MARDNFELLGPRLSLELSQSHGLSLREVSFWVDAMFRFAATPVDNPGRVRALAATVFENPGAEAAAHERLVALLGLLTSLMRVVLVADEIEGFSSDETAALRLASFVGVLRQSVERVDVVLSVNKDIWESAFLPRLSGGLADRLSEVVVELEPLNRESMIAVIESRSPGSGEKIFSEINSGSVPSHARGLIKEAGIAWEDVTTGRPRKSPEPPKTEDSPPAYAPAEVSGPSAVVEPLPEPAPPVSRETEGPVVDPYSRFATSASDTPPPFFAPPEKQEEQPPSAHPAEGGFSAEAAIAAFAAASSRDASGESSSPGSLEKRAEDKTPAEIPTPDFSAPPSWPSPEIQTSDSPRQMADETPSRFSTQPPSSDKTPPPEPVEQPAPSPPEQKSSFFQPEPEPREEAVSAFQAPPEDIGSDSPFLAGKTPSSDEDSESSGEEKAEAPSDSSPTTPATESATNPQPPEVPASSDEKAEGSTDRVDDLLRQFRERYGKS